jgi:hypothetical protein
MSLRGWIAPEAGGVGIVLVWAAAAWAVTKAWSFPVLAWMPSVAKRAEVWGPRRFGNGMSAGVSQHV